MTYVSLGGEGGELRNTEMQCRNEDRKMGWSRGKTWDGLE